MSVSKIVAAAASSAGGAGLDVDDCFSTFLWDGNGSTQTITNNIDLSGEGGLVWIKSRDQALVHGLFDTERGIGSSFAYRLFSDDTNAQSELTDGLSAFNSNGFTLGNSTAVNGNTYEYVSWTWRKASKFFDVVTYTGNGVAGRTISHNLDTLVGMLMIKCTSHSSDWSVQHRMVLPTKYLALNETTSAQTDTARFHSTAAGSSTFSVGSGNAVNGSGRTYVAYLFAHNNTGNPGEFGPDSDQDIIKCGDFTTDGSENATITLGFEPQWVLWKETTRSTNWGLADAMRGMPVGQADALLEPNANGAETAGVPYISPTPTGFNVTNMGVSKHSIFMAIRRGPLAVPEDATKVFAVNTRSSSDGEGKYTSGFPVDFSLANNYDQAGNTFAGTRLLNEHLQTNDNVTGGSSASDYQWDHNDGLGIGMAGAFFGGSTNNINWMWKRAKGYFDVVVYEGPSTTGNISHNLGVVPEMMWVKNTDATENWAVYHKDLGNTYYLHLNTTAAASNTDGGNFWNSTTPTASVFSVGTSSLTSHYTRKHVAYLFATCSGVSKVGSYTGTGSSQNIDCGFSSGARFVLVKRHDGTDSWYIADSVRGISSGQTDKIIKLNSTDAQFTESDNSADYIAPHASGFNVPANSPLNGNGDDFIFYAIA